MIQPLPPVATTPRPMTTTTPMPTRSLVSATPPRLAYPTVPGASGAALPARVTPAGRAAVTSMAANSAVRAGLARAEPDAREAAKSVGPIPVVRASSFPGVDQ